MTYIRINIVNKIAMFDKVKVSLQALILASQPPDPHEHVGCNVDDEASVFFLEFLIKVALQNR